MPETLLNNSMSGDKVFLCEQDGKKYIKKVSKKRPEALYKAGALSGAGFNCPEILQRPKLTEKGWVYSIEYLEGAKTIKEHIKEEEDLLPFFNFLKFYFLSVQGLSGSSEPINLDFIKERVRESEKLSSGLFISTEDWFKTALKHIPECLFYDYCHGDLTFENIMVRKEQEGFKFYLIDYHQTEYQSLFFDKIKILQDLKGFLFLRGVREKDGWSFKDFNDTIEKTKVLRGWLLNVFPEMRSDNNYFFSLLRILPYYLKHGADKEKIYLTNAIKEVLNRLRGG